MNYSDTKTKFLSLFTALLTSFGIFGQANAAETTIYRNLATGAVSSPTY